MPVEIEGTDPRVWVEAWNMLYQSPSSWMVIGLVLIFILVNSRMLARKKD